MIIQQNETKEGSGLFAFRTQENKSKEGTGMFIFGAQHSYAEFKPIPAFSKSRGRDLFRVALNAQGKTETVSLATSPSISRTSTLANLSETSDSLEITLEEPKLPVFGLAAPLGPNSFIEAKGMYLTLYIPLYAEPCQGVLKMSA